MKFKMLYDKWKEFKDERKSRPTICIGNPCFLTVNQREKLIDLLFKEVERLQNA